MIRVRIYDIKKEAIITKKSDTHCRDTNQLIYITFYSFQTDLNKQNAIIIHHRELRRQS